MIIARKPAGPTTGKPKKRTVPVPKLPVSPGTPRKKAVAAGPRKPPAAPAATPKPKAGEASRLEKLEKLILASLEDDKAEEVVSLDVAGRAAFADRMIIATGIADRQIAAIAQHLEEKLAKAGLKRVQIEGAAGSDWVLIDAGDIVVHLFKPEARSLYALERMWGPELDQVPDSAD